MPAPDPFAINVEKTPDGWHVTYERYLWSRSDGNRKARVMGLLRRLVGKSWRCNWCGDDLPVYKRRDALYCNERCRKLAAIRRRGDRQCAERCQSHTHRAETTSSPR